MHRHTQKHAQEEFASFPVGDTAVASYRKVLDTYTRAKTTLSTKKKKKERAKRGKKDQKQFVLSYALLAITGKRDSTKHTKKKKMCVAINAMA
jgi:hypothetical protein